METTVRGGARLATLAALCLACAVLPYSAQARLQAPSAGENTPAAVGAPVQQPPPPTRPGAGQQAPPLKPLTTSHLQEGRRPTDADQPLSLSFSEPVAVRELLLLLVRDTNLSVVPDPDVDGTFSGELKNVTLRQALDLILQPLGLEYGLQDNVLRVYRRKLVTRIFSVNYVSTRRNGSRGLNSSTGATGGQWSAVGGAGLAGGLGPAAATSVAGMGLAGVAGSFGGSQASVSASDTGDVFEEFQAGVQTLLSPDARFNLDRKAGLLQVTDYPDRLDRIALYLEAARVARAAAGPDPGEGRRGRVARRLRGRHQLGGRVPHPPASR